MRNATSKAVADKVSSMFPNSGYPTEVFTDNGTEFAGHFAEMLKNLEIVHVHSPPYSPQNNKVERVHRDMNATWRILMENQSDWSKKLSMAITNHNMARHEATGFSPYELFHGRAPLLPGDTALTSQSPTEQVARDRRQLPMRRAAVEEKQLQQHARNARRYKPTPAFDVHDWIWIYLLDHERPRKLMRHFDGPYIILEKLGDQMMKVARIMEPDMRPSEVTKIVHIGRIKHYRLAHPVKRKRAQRHRGEGTAAPQRDVSEDDAVVTSDDDEDGDPPPTILPMAPHWDDSDSDSPEEEPRGASEQHDAGDEQSPREGGNGSNGPVDELIDPQVHTPRRPQVVEDEISREPAGRGQSPLQRFTRRLRRRIPRLQVDWSRPSYNRINTGLDQLVVRARHRMVFKGQERIPVCLKIQGSSSKLNQQLSFVPSGKITSYFLLGAEVEETPSGLWLQVTNRKMSARTIEKGQILGVLQA